MNIGNVSEDVAQGLIVGNVGRDLVAVEYYFKLFFVAFQGIGQGVLESCSNTGFPTHQCKAKDTALHEYVRESVER